MSRAHGYLRICYKCFFSWRSWTGSGAFCTACSRKRKQELSKEYRTKLRLCYLCFNPFEATRLDSVIGPCCRKKRQKTLDSSGRLKRLYKYSQAEYEALLREQKYVCAICLKHRYVRGKTQLYIDHNHQTGQVRGLLCHYCNVALGHFEDSEAILYRARQYLLK